MSTYFQLMKFRKMRSKKGHQAHPKFFKKINKNKRDFLKLMNKRECFNLLHHPNWFEKGLSSSFCSVFMKNFPYARRKAEYIKKYSILKTSSLLSACFLPLNSIHDELALL